jgi:glycosyltransferase involved in cell wall biosynthesis
VWRALHGTSTPYFVFTHGMLDPWFKRTYPLKHIKKLLYWPWGEYRVLRDAAAVLFTSEQERRLARQSFALYRCHEEVVNYGTAAPSVDLAAARAEFIAAYPQLAGKRLLLFLGRLHEKKGCDLLVEAFVARGRESASSKDLHLVMAGPARDQDYLRRLKELAGTDSAVTFPGMLTGNLKWGAFAAADAFVLPSHQENFGIAVVEAMACGTPVLVSKEVNIWREIVDDGAGFAEEDNATGTARLLERWLSLPHADAEAMRRAARASFNNRYEIHRAVDSLVDVLQRHGVRAERTA